MKVRIKTVNESDAYFGHKLEGIVMKAKEVGQGVDGDNSYYVKGTVLKTPVGCNEDTVVGDYLCFCSVDIEIL